MPVVITADYIEHWRKAVKVAVVQCCELVRELKHRLSVKPVAACIRICESHRKIMKLIAPTDMHVCGHDIEIIVHCSAETLGFRLKNSTLRFDA